MTEKTPPMTLPSRALIERILSALAGFVLAAVAGLLYAGVTARGFGAAPALLAVGILLGVFGGWKAGLLFKRWSDKGAQDISEDGKASFLTGQLHEVEYQIDQFKHLHPDIFLGLLLGRQKILKANLKTRLFGNYVIDPDTGKVKFPSEKTAASETKDTP